MPVIEKKKGYIKVKKISKDKGVIFVLLDRFNKQRLPRATDMKKRVDRGELLGKADYAYIKNVLKDAGEIEKLAKRNPEYMELYEKAFNLWKEILDKDLENQEKSRQ